MKIAILVVMLQATAFSACKEGYVPTDVEGVCQKADTRQTNPDWIIDEKPSFHPQPAYQRGEVTIVDAPNLEAQDRKDDLEKEQANKEGRKKAGLK